MQKIRSGVKRKCSDQDGTLSSLELGSKPRPHKSRVLIHAIFTLMIRELLMNLLLLSHGSFFLDPCGIVFIFSHPFLAIPCYSVSCLHECKG